MSPKPHTQSHSHARALGAGRTQNQLGFDAMRAILVELERFGLGGAAGADAALLDESDALLSETDFCILLNQWIRQPW